MWRVLPESPEEDTPFEFAHPWKDDPEAVAEARCGHFSVTASTLHLPGVAPPMQVPIYRCALAEVMIVRMRSIEEGRQLAARLEAPPFEGHPRGAYGPDLEAITTNSCTIDRCRRSCHAGFIQILADLGLDASLPEDH